MAGVVRGDGRDWLLVMVFVGVRWLWWTGRLGCIGPFRASTSGTSRTPRDGAAGLALAGCACAARLDSTPVPHPKRSSEPALRAPGGRTGAPARRRWPTIRARRPVEGKSIRPRARFACRPHSRPGLARGAKRITALGTVASLCSPRGAIWASVRNLSRTPPREYIQNLSAAWPPTREPVLPVGAE